MNPLLILALVILFWLTYSALAVWAGAVYAISLLVAVAVWRIAYMARHR
jgi:hypothetical protein